MSQDYEKLFSHLRQPKVPDSLLSGIITSIRRAERRRAAERLILFFPLSIGSLIALYFTFRSTWAASAESGFFSYLSLLFSDFQVVITHWQNYSLSLLETLPAISISLSLASILLLINFIRLFVREARNIYAPLSASKA
jgi:hypothetical protein